MGAVISFFRPASTSQGGWSPQELAEFYRVEAALIRAGLQIGSEQGLSDEAEPWFVFCRPDGDAIMHFARIDGSYVIASEVLDSPMRGSDFRALIDQIAQRYPELLPIPQGADGTKLTVHPAALLAALVAAAALRASPDDARADDGERSAQSAVRALHAGQTLQHGLTGAPDHGGADERDSHRKQIGIIVFSAMVFAADAFAADHPERGIEAKLTLGSPGGVSAFSGDQGDVSVNTGGAVHAAHSAAPLNTGRHETASSGAAGSATAEPTSPASSRSDATDLGPIALRDPALSHEAARTGLEPAFQILTRGAEASTTRTAGSSSSPDAGSDGSAAASGSAEARGQAEPSSSTTGEAAPQTQIAPQATGGHAASDASPAQVNGANAATSPEQRHAPYIPVEERPGHPEYAARTDALPVASGQRDGSVVVDGSPSGTAGGASEREQHGAGGHAATAVASLNPSGGVTAQVQVDGADPGRAQAGEGPGRSAEAPGHLKDAVPGELDADGHSAIDGASSHAPSSITQAAAGAAAPGRAELGEGPGEGPGKSAEVPGHLKDTGLHPRGADGHGTASDADPDSPSASAQAAAGAAARGHAQLGEGPGKSTEAPGHLENTGSHSQGADSHVSATDTNAGASPVIAQGRAVGSDPGHPHVDVEPKGAIHDTVGRTAAPGSQVGPAEPVDHRGTTATGNTSRDQAPSTHQNSPANWGSHVPPPVASIDPNGDLVFSSGNSHGPSTGPNHGSVDHGAHGDVELIGISDHSTDAHHFDLHS